MNPARGDTGPKLLYVPRHDAELRRVVLQETRALLLDLLRRPRADGRRGWSVQELSRRLECTTQNVHHHLKILEERGLARVAMHEETNGLARQYWTTDVDHVYTDMAPEAKAALALDKARAHHNPSSAEAAYYDRHFDAMALLGAPVPRDARAAVVAFYRRETALFERAFQGLEPGLRDAAARTGTAEAKSALHFAAIARFSEQEFDDWVAGLRALRTAANRDATRTPAAPPRPPHALTVAGDGEAGHDDAAPGGRGAPGVPSRQEAPVPWRGGAT